MPVQESRSDATEIRESGATSSTARKSSTLDQLSADRARALQQALESSIRGEIRFDLVSRGIYSTDASVYQIIPAGVVIPRSREDVIQVVKIASEYGVSITARGGGTSQAGQAVGEGLQLDCSKYLNRIIDLDVERREVSVEPGIVLDELNRSLEGHGLQLPLDLSTSSRATVGGAIANNSAGTRSVVYGKTIDYVLELTVVLADGSVVQMKPRDVVSLNSKCSQTNLEGQCYRVVRHLAGEHAEEIERRYPKIMRRVGGYNLDDFTSPSQPFNLARMMVGSEGTLGMVVEAKLRLVEVPGARVLCVVQFEELLDALSATPLILEHDPSAVELLDRFILDTTRGKIAYEPLRDFIQGDPGGVLLVEFHGDDTNDLVGRIEQLELDLSGRGIGNHFHRAIDSRAQARIWELRKAGLGLSMSQRGDAKAISFVEDTAVSLENLRDYIERFMALLEKHDTRAGFYAHASVGLLHVRPVVNMKSADGVAKFTRIAQEVADLVLEYGGALSAEHGDGLVRAPFQEQMYGPVLYQAFCQLKSTFDPKGIFNPGKIVRAPPITDNLRFPSQYTTMEPRTGFDFSDFGGIARAAEQCTGVGACRKTLTGTMCPSYMATRDESDVTRGRANALRLALSGRLGADGLAQKDLYPVLDLCLECKACKTECPTGVDMARLKSEFLHQYQLRHGASWRARMLANADTLAVWGSRFAPLSNWVASNFLVRWLNEKLLGLDRRRLPPAFARETFLDWWRRNGEQYGGQEEAPQLAVFADTFTNYHEPQHAQAAVRVAHQLGVRTTVPQRVCCGRPLISKGFLQEARRQAEATTQILKPLAEQGLPILFCEPSCYSAVKDDHAFLVGQSLKEDAKKVAAAAVTFEEWVESVLEPGSSGPQIEAGSRFGAGPEKILVHGHCHQKALVGTEPALSLLCRIPGAEVSEVDSGCCGMAGSFGYEHEHYEVSQAVGARKLFPALEAMAPESVVVASGFSCRHQIRHFAGVDAVSPMELVESSLDSSVHGSLKRKRGVGPQRDVSTSEL